MPISVSDGLEQRHDAVGDELVERLDVVGHARDQHARRAALVEADRQRLQVAEDAAGAGPAARAGRPSRRGRSARRSRAQTSSAETRNATTTRSSVATSPCGMPSSIAGLASGGGASDAAVPSDQRDEHQHRRAPGRAAAARAARAACARARSVPRRRRRRSSRRTSAAWRAHRPATSRSSGLRVRKTWSGRPFSTISRYSSDCVEQLVVACRARRSGRPRARRSRRPARSSTAGGR